MILLLLACFLTAPAFDAGEGPNACYVLDRELRQVNGPCRWDETRGVRDPQR